MLKLHKRLASALCGIFSAAALLSSQGLIQGEELVKGFPRDFNLRSLIRATDSGETLEYCAFCGPVQDGGAYIVSFNVPGILGIDNNNVDEDRMICLPTDVYGDGKEVTSSLTAYQIYQSNLVENTVGFLSVYYTEDFSQKYYSQLGDAKMAPLSSVSKGDKVYIATFDSPEEVVTDYGYVDSVQISDQTFVVNTNEQWTNNDYILWVGAPIINQNGEVIGVLMPIDQDDPNQALIYAMDDVIKFLEKKCGFSVYGGGSSSSGGSGNSSDKDDEGGGSVTEKDNNNGSGKNDDKNSDKNGDEGKGMSAGVIFIIVLLVVGAAVGGFFIFRKKNSSTAVPPPQNYGQPPANQPQTYGQPPVQSPVNQPQTYDRQMPANQPQDYGQQQVQQSAPPADPQSYQMFNSQDSLDKNQVPATTFLQPSLILKCVGGTLNGNSYQIADTICIGRNAALCGVVYPEGEPGVSGMHCKIAQSNGQVQLTDMGSSSGTYINGVQILPNVPYPMPVGSSFYIGSPQNTFVISE